MSMTVQEFKDMLDTLTKNELNNDVYKRILDKRGLGDTPVLASGESKSQVIYAYLRWVRRNTKENLPLLKRLVDERLEAKRMAELALPSGNLRYIKYADLKKLPSFEQIREAIEYKQKSPLTAEGYVSVAAIYNMSSWASWKMSSLSPHERKKAEAIGDLQLHKLMGLNKGRRMNKPALFPVGLLQ